MRNFAHQLAFWFVNNATATSSVTFNLTAEQCASGVGSECVGTQQVNIYVLLYVLIRNILSSYRFVYYCRSFSYFDRGCNLFPPQLEFLSQHQQNFVLL
jgi:hypothetical protein